MFTDIIRVLQDCKPAVRVERLEFTMVDEEKGDIDCVVENLGYCTSLQVAQGKYPDAILDEDGSVCPIS